MNQALFYMASSFWAGVVHAATPGHGKTIAAAYIVGARGRPVDAVILGIFVTLSHVSGIVLVGVLASLRFKLAGASAHRGDTGAGYGIAGYRAGFLDAVDAAGTDRACLAQQDPGQPRASAWASHGHDHAHHHDHQHGHEHEHGQLRILMTMTTLIATTMTMIMRLLAVMPTTIRTASVWHSHGWGTQHAHRLDLVTGERPAAGGADDA